MINWNGLKVPAQTLRKIRSLISYLLTITDHPGEILEDGKATIIEFTFQLGRSLWDVSDEAFVHAFQASLALQRFLAVPNEINRSSTKTHLEMIRAMLFSDERAGEDLPNDERIRL